MTTMRPFWRYYGGKWRAAPKYGDPVPGLPIIEPFAGAAGYATRFGAGRDVLLIDRDPKIVAIWQWLIDATPDDVLAIGDIPDGGTVDDLDAPQAARWLAGFWCNNGAAQPFKSPSKWSSMSGRWFGWGAQARARISGQVESLRGWSVIEGDYSDAPDVRATWFVDPPYSTPAGAYYRFNASGIDFAHLGAWCVSRQGRVVVCEQQGADWLPFVSMGAQKSARAGKPSREVVWCNEMRQADLFFGNGDAR